MAAAGDPPLLGALPYFTAKTVVEEPSSLCGASVTIESLGWNLLIGLLLPEAREFFPQFMVVTARRQEHLAPMTCDAAETQELDRYLGK